jgi:septal ring factor EnvC (AmiA/AmiB activator)
MSECANESLDCERYRNNISELEEQLHQLEDELLESKIEYLTENHSYSCIDINSNRILIPVESEIGRQQLMNLLRKIPYNTQESYMTMYYVTDEHRNMARESDEYQVVVEKRKEIIEDIKEQYKDFWEQEVIQLSEPKGDLVKCMLNGLDRDIGSEMMSDITGIPVSECKYIKEDM